MLKFADTGGLFDHFEVNREPFWPRIMWLVAGSGAWHLVVVAAIVLIPPVRNALSIAAVFSGADFVDRPYKRTEIDDADIIDFSNEKFHYPEGYFALDLPGGAPPEYPTMPPIKPAWMSPAGTPTVTPTPTPTPAVASAPLIASNTGGKSADAKPSPAKPTEDKSVEQAQKDLEAASKKTGIDLPQEGEINKAPFKELAAYATDLRDHGKLDFNQPFEVTIDTTLDKNGKLVDPKMTKRVGDEVLVELGKRLVAAMNDSGVLFYLKKINDDKPGTKVVFTIKQDAKDVSAIVESEVASDDHARVLSKDFAIMLAAGALSRKGKDEEVLLRSTKVSADGSKIVFSLSMPHDDVVDLVKKGMATPTPTVSPG